MGEEKVWRLWPHQGEKKGKNLIYCTISCKAEPLCFPSTTLRSRLHLLMAKSRDNTLSSEIINTSEAEQSSLLRELWASGLAPISKDRTVQSRFSYISIQRFLSHSASAELKQTQMNNNHLITSEVTPCSPSALKKLSDILSDMGGRSSPIVLPHFICKLTLKMRMKTSNVMPPNYVACSGSHRSLGPVPTRFAAGNRALLQDLESSDGITSQHRDWPGSCWLTLNKKLPVYVWSQ